MVQKLLSPKALEGEVTIPGDKSISHRAAILNAIARGNARVRNYSTGEDCASTLACLRQLGVAISGAPPDITVEGTAGVLRESEDILDAGNSGTTMRLLAGALAAQPFLSIITGDSSLRSRPMDRIVKPLGLMGAQIWCRGGSHAPLAIKGGNLRGISYSSPVASAQVKSAILIAALFANEPTTVQEPALSRDHTERMLKTMGARLQGEGPTITVWPATLASMDVHVPGDISGAAFWLVAGATHPNARVRVLNVGLNPTRTGVLEALNSMGARLRIIQRRDEGSEPVGDLEVESSRMRGIEIKGDLVPRLIDEIPVLAVAATQAQGNTVIRDAAELRVKESDRIGAMCRELRKLGARVEELPDGMIIHGPTALKGVACSSYGDHRLAMAMAVAGLLAKGETVVDGAEAASVSYPGFWQEIAALTGKAHDR